MRRKVTFFLFCYLIPASLLGGEFVEVMRDRWRERREALSYVPRIMEVIQQGTALTIEHLDKSPYLPFAIASAYERLGSKEMALLYYEKSLEKAGDDETYLFDLLLLFEGRGQRELYNRAVETILQNVGWGDRNEEISTFFYLKGKDLLRKGEKKEGIMILRLARDLNPWDLRNHFTLFLDHLNSLNQEVFDDLNWILYAVKKDFKVQHLFFLTLYRTILLLILFFSIFIATGFLLRTIPFLHHQLFERLSTFRISTLLRLSLPARKIGGWLLLSTPLLMGLPASLLLLISLPILWILEKGRKERFLLFLVFLFLILYPFFMGVDSKLYRPLHPDRDLRFLLSQTKSQEDLRELYLQAEREKDPALYFTIGLIEKEETSYLAAKEAYQRAYDRAQTTDLQSIILNNLGNLYFELGDYEKAIGSYEKAIQLHPDFPLPHFNLSQVFSLLIRLEEATGHFDQALALDPLLSRAGRRVIDETLPSTYLWRRTFETSSLSIGDLVRRGGGFTRSLLPFLILVFALVFSMFLDQRSILLICQLCGRPVCSQCSKEEEGLCPRCWKTLSTTSPTLQEQFKERRKQESMKSLRNRAWICTLLYPGLGHLYIGSPLKGVLIGIIASLFWGYTIQIHPIYLSPLNLVFPPYPIFLIFVILNLLALRSIQKTLLKRGEPLPEKVEKQPLKKVRKGFVEARLMDEKEKREEI